MARANSRTQAERARDHARVIELYLQGWRQSEIAADVGISQAQVSKEISKQERDWKEQPKADMDLLMRKQAAKFDMVERSAWDGWSRSQKEAKKSKARKSEKDGSGVKEAISETETQAGDPRFLDLVLKASSARGELLGLNAPIEHRDVGATTVVYLPSNGRDTENHDHDSPAAGPAGTVPVEPG